MNNLLYAMDAYSHQNYLPIHESETEKLCPIVASPEHALLAAERYQLLSDNAKEVIDIVLNPPEAFQRRLNIKNRTAISQGKLTEFLRLIDSRRWKHSTINLVFIEIKQFLKET